MLARMCLALLALSVAGCTNVQLRCSTVRQLETLTEVQHQVVLNNLAAFACNPDAIPSQANLIAGATQIVDYGTAGTQFVNAAFVALGLSRGIVDQWSNAPVTDEMALRLLRVAYRRSLGFDEDLYTGDLANRLAHRLKMQMLSTADLGIANSLMYARGPALPQLLDRAGWKGEEQLGFKSNDPAVQLWQKDNADIICLNSDRIVQDGERLTEENLAVAPALVNGQPYVVANEAGPRVKVATPYATELRRQVLALNRYITEITPGWLHRGEKHDVPQCVCYKAHHKNCGCECWVWVTPEDQPAFEEFTLHILRLSNLVQQPGATTPTGIMYSPIQVR